MRHYSAEEVLAAAFAKRVMDDADAQGWFILDVLESWYGALEGGIGLVAEMRRKCSMGRCVLDKAQLVIGNSATPGTALERAHKASVARRCPNSVIMPAVGGRRAGQERIRHIGLRARNAETPKS